MQTTSNIQYKIFFSHRRSISIIVSPDKGVVVKAPFRTPVRTIEKFVNEKSDWIKKSLDKFKSLHRLTNSGKYFDGDTLLFMGREHILKLVAAEKYWVRPLAEQFIEVGVNGNSNPLIINAILENWFKMVANKILSVKFREILSKYSSYGFSPTGFRVRKMKSRWGSCSSTGRISLSYDLIKLDEIYSEYVIIHELCHLRHHNHGTGYYKLLAELYPEWKAAREGLKKYIR